MIQQGPNSFPETNTSPHFVETPHVVIDESIRGEIHAQLLEVLSVLNNDLEANLQAVGVFSRNPHSFPLDNPLHLLTIHHEISQGYYFDDATEVAIQKDDKFRRIRQQTSLDQGILLRARRLEIYLARRISYTKAGEIAIADSGYPVA